MIQANSRYLIKFHDFLVFFCVNFIAKSSNKIDVVFIIYISIEFAVRSAINHHNSTRCGCFETTLPLAYFTCKRNNSLNEIRFLLGMDCFINPKIWQHIFQLLRTMYLYNVHVLYVHCPWFEIQTYVIEILSIL